MDFFCVTNHCSWQIQADFCFLNFIFSLKDMCVDSFKMIYNQNEFLGLPLLFLIRWKCTWIIAFVIKSMCFIPCLWIRNTEEEKSRELAKRGKNKEGKLTLEISLKVLLVHQKCRKSYNILVTLLLPINIIITIYLITWSFNRENFLYPLGREVVSRRAWFCVPAKILI